MPKVKCTHCDGSGYHGKKKCPVCKGTGFVKSKKKKKGLPHDELFRRGTSTGTKMVDSTTILNPESWKEY